MLPTKATGTTLGHGAAFDRFLVFWLTERRRSRTDPAWGCHASPILKTGWATGPMPLRSQRNKRVFGLSAVSRGATVKPRCPLASDQAMPAVEWRQMPRYLVVRTFEVEQAAMPDVGRRPIFRPLLKRYALRRRDCPRKGTVPGNAATLGRVLGTVPRGGTVPACVGAPA